MITRYDLGTSRESGIGQPGITEQIDGAYVRHDDHQALMQEKDAEIAALERTVVDQTVVITELREHRGPVADCYSGDDGDSWHDCPDDIKFVHGLTVGNEYELQASIDHGRSDSA